MTLIEIKPLDTLFFRDARSFVIGEDTTAKGRLWPPLSTITGALRSQYFRKFKKEFVNANTDKDSTLNIKIESIFFKVEGKYQGIYCPMPRDIVAIKKPLDSSQNEKRESSRNQDPAIYHGTVATLKKIPEGASCSTRNTHYLSSEMKGKGIKDTALISVKDLDKYLKGEKEDFEIIDFRSLYSSEKKIGIALDPRTKSVKESHLYSIEMIRYQTVDSNLSFIIKLDLGNIDPSVFDKAVIRLGGEGKLAVLNVLSDKDIDQSRFCSDYEIINSLTPIKTGDILPDGIFKVYNIIHMHPEVLSESEQVCTSSGRPAWEGGFDMKKRKPKLTRFMVPRGSVHYLKGKQNNNNFQTPSKWGDLSQTTLFLGKIKGDKNE